ncbi:MAG: beta-lactamase family protein [Verrucomicrobia bacterium]|nr:beta-lactamase family protein [Verrucomicrobiota bacterium]
MRPALATNILAACLSSAAAAQPSPEFVIAIESLQRLAAAEVERGILPGFTLALVDDQRLVWSGGFGLADVKRKLPARPDTVYRVGSVSKLFNAVAVMQQVETGRLDLDAPVQKFVPDFRIESRFTNAGPVTLRQLLCHRSGLIRESPVGGYYDDQQPTILATVRSVADCALVNPPNTQTRYSNIGATVAGYAVQSVTGTGYDFYARERLLKPLGMQDSSFVLTPAVQRKLSNSYMRIANADGTFRHEASPLFELGTIPAGNLYASAEDLARFMSCLFAEGKTAEGGQILRAATLNEMCTPQLTTATNGFGLGFSIGRFGNFKTVSHSGAVYGFSSSFIALPGPKVGVIVLANEDIAMGPVGKLAEAGLELLLQAKLGRTPTAKPEPVKLDPAALAALAGEYESESYWAKLEVDGDKLRANIASQELVFTPLSPTKFRADGRFSHNGPVEFSRNASGQVSFTALGQRFSPAPSNPPLIPPAWQKFLGSYGPKFIPAIVSVRHGHLYVMTENMVDYRLRPVNRTTFAFPPGLYTDEHLVFNMDTTGKARSVVLANMELKRN